MRTENAEARRAAVVEAAMNLFWREGAKAASYDRLVAATGLSRKALYGAWPDKRALFYEALAVYRRDVLGFMIGLLRPPAKASLARFWEQLGEAALREGWNGCMLFRSASGEFRGDARVRAVFLDYTDELARTIADAVAAGRSAGELTPGIAPVRVGQLAIAIVSLISVHGSLDGNSPRVAGLIEAGREICGLG